MELRCCTLLLCSGIQIVLEGLAGRSDFKFETLTSYPHELQLPSADPSGKLEIGTLDR